MTDELIILLSTSWFLPYWKRIGIEISDTGKHCVLDGCRRIVSRMIGDADRMYQVDFTERRRHETDSGFRTLLQECAAGWELSAAHEEWGNRTDKDNYKTWNWFHLNQIICSRRIPGEYPALAAEIRCPVIDSWTLFEFEASDIRNACTDSPDAWDRRIHSTMGGAEVLYDALMNVLRDRTLRAFWNQLRTNLTEQQLHDLIAWYRAVTVIMTRGERPDLLPPYVTWAPL